MVLIIHPFWSDLPSERERGWISLATYTNARNWTDLFGLNLVSINEIFQLKILHVPTFGKGDFKSEKNIAFLMRRWVYRKVEVDFESLMVYQDGNLVATPKKEMGCQRAGDM